MAYTSGVLSTDAACGVPTVIVPFILDQFFWGARVKALGVGPDPIPRKKLTAGRLAQAIRAAVADTEMRRRARACGEAVRAQDGVGEAVQVVQRYLGPPRLGESEEAS